MDEMLVSTLLKSIVPASVGSRQGPVDIHTHTHTQRERERVLMTGVCVKKGGGKRHKVGRGGWGRGGEELMGGGGGEETAGSSGHLRSGPI